MVSKNKKEVAAAPTGSLISRTKTSSWVRLVPFVLVGFAAYVVFATPVFMAISHISLLRSVTITLFSGAIFSVVGLGAAWAAIYSRLIDPDKEYGDGLEALISSHKNGESGEHTRARKGFLDKKTPKDPKLPVPNSQQDLRDASRYELLERESRMTHDKVLGMGAKISVALVAFWLMMYFAFGLSPKETFLVPWPVLILIWFIQIALFPKWMTYFSFLSVAGLRFAFQVFGPTILIMLPNFLMLPFFYFFMMFFMFGSIMIPTIMQFKFYRPGDATWETPEGSVRGQPEARAKIKTQMRRFHDYAAGKTVQKPTRGMTFVGPPGTGKTLMGKEIATGARLPFIYADGNAFNVPFMGFDSLLFSFYLKPRTESLARQFGGAVFVIDEAENFLQRRGGMGQTSPGAGMERITTVEDVLRFDNFGTISECGLSLDTAYARERFWDQKFPSPREREYAHKFFMGGMGGMGGSGAILSFLTWVSGTDSPPMTAQLKRRITINLLDALFIPLKVGNKVLRPAPAKATHFNLMFIALTNRPWMLDPAVTRAGRLGVRVEFTSPDLDARADIGEHYLKIAHSKGFVHPDLLQKARVLELADITAGMSPAEIEQVITEAPDKRGEHVANLKRIKEAIESGTPIEELLEQDGKYWLRYKDDVGKPGWDDDRADWHSLAEALSSIKYGEANPSMTSEEHRKTTARHEFRGHFLQLHAFMGKWMKPSVLTIMPRRGALGMVSHIPLNDRDPRPKEYFEALLRVSVGSTAAELFYFGSNQPGVSSDLENATNIACFMVGKCAMRPYSCSEEDYRRYKKIGEPLVSVPDSSGSLMGEDVRSSFVSSILRGRDTGERVAVFLGQAFVDDYRLIRLNANRLNDIDGGEGELLRIDEFSGNKLDQLWQRLSSELVTLEKLQRDEPDNPNLTVWPDRILQASNYFYGAKPSEAEELLRAGKVSS